MKFQKLGNTDIDVSVVALGTWGLGGGSVCLIFVMNMA